MNSLCRLSLVLLLLVLLLLGGCHSGSGSEVSSVRDLAHLLGCTHVKEVKPGPFATESATCELDRATLVLDYIADPDDMAAFEKSIGGQRMLYGPDWAVYSLRPVLEELQGKVGGQIKPTVTG